MCSTRRTATLIVQVTTCMHAQWFSALRIPRRFQIRYESLNLNRLQHLIDCGRVDTSQRIDMRTLVDAGAVGKIEHGVKLLADVSTVHKAPHVAVCVLRALPRVISQSILW